MVVPQFWSANGLAMGMTGEQRAAFGGPVDAGMTYGEWLARQDAATQDRVLGVTRARAFRAGKVEFGDFFDDRGLFLTIDEIEELEAA